MKKFVRVKIEEEPVEWEQLEAGDIFRIVTDEAGEGSLGKEQTLLRALTDDEGGSIKVQIEGKLWEHVCPGCGGTLCPRSGCWHGKQAGA